MRVPQGSILSVTLFILKINSIADVILSSFEKSLFVDDFSISCSSRNGFNRKATSVLSQ